MDSAIYLFEKAVTVTRSGPTTGEAFVSYGTSDLTATERRDYTAVVGRLRFAAGETTKTFEVLLTDDAFDDDCESFNLKASATLSSQP